MDSASHPGTRSVLSHDQVIQWTRAKKVREIQLQDGKVKWKNFKCLLLTKNCWELMENQLNSSGIFSQDSGHCRFFRKSRMICESGKLNLKNLQTGSSSCQCSTTSIGQEKERLKLENRIQKKSRNTRRYSRKDTGRFWVLEMKRSGTEVLLTHLKEKGILQPLRWWNDSKRQVHPVFKSINALSRGILKRRMAETPYTLTLVPNHSLCKSAQYLRSIYELV